MKPLMPLLLVMTCLFSVKSYADSTGKAMIPHWNAFYSGSANNEFSSTQIHISNISDVMITVEMKLFDAEGDLASSEDFDASILPVGSLLNCNTMGTLCDLPPHSSGFFFIHNDSENEFPFTTGYGTLEWTAYSDLHIAMLAQGMVLSERSDSRSSRMSTSLAIPINNGLPF